MNDRDVVLKQPAAVCKRERQVSDLSSKSHSLQSRRKKVGIHNNILIMSHLKYLIIETWNKSETYL